MYKIVDIEHILQHVLTRFYSSLQVSTITVGASQSIQKIKIKQGSSV